MPQWTAESVAGTPQHKVNRTRHAEPQVLHCVARPFRGSSLMSSWQKKKNPTFHRVVTVKIISSISQLRWRPEQVKGDRYREQITRIELEQSGTGQLAIVTGHWLPACRALKALIIGRLNHNVIS